MEKNVRLVDIARAAGVSQGTASNVFNRPHLVRAEVRERVEAAAQAMGYRGPDPRGKMLRAGRVNAIGVATSEPLPYFFADPFACALMTGIAEACDAHGAGLALVSAMNDERLAWNIQSALVDGFILLCIDEGERLVALTRERQLPFVALHLGQDDETMSAIGIDNAAGAKLAARHLTELGHRRFAILSLPFSDERYGIMLPGELRSAVYTTSRDRALGYLAALAEAGIEARRVPIYETQNEPESIRAGLEVLFDGPEPPTALLAMSDRIALEALAWLRRRGIAVPGAVSVIGFDGVPAGETSDPPLTTIAQPIAEIGRRAVDMILDHDGALRRETLAVTLARRGSTGPPPAW